MTTWLIVCEGPSHKGYEQLTRKLIEKYKETSIGVNYAGLLPVRHWMFLDSDMWRCISDELRPDQKVICNRGVAQHPRRGKIKVFKTVSTCLECSGNAAIKYAIDQGATDIITIGHDLTKEWTHYNDRPGKIQHDLYITTVVNVLRRLQKEARIYSLNPDNPLGLPCWDEKGD